MFKRKLIALDFHNASNFDHKDEAQFRNLVVWVEDQKIRHYKIEDRSALRNVCAGDWNTGFHKYLDDLECPLQDKSNRPSVLDWLLGQAVRLEYGDGADKYQTAAASSATSSSAKQSTNPLDSMDFDSADFKAGVASLSQLLQIPPHSDHTLVLKAICHLVKERLTAQQIEKASKNQGAKELPSLPLDQMELGFEAGDYISQEASKILRLLHIRELRDLQNRINEAVVQVQALIANPKTDSRLGKVGK